MATTSKRARANEVVWQVRSKLDQVLSACDKLQGCIEHHYAVCDLHTERTPEAQAHRDAVKLYKLIDAMTTKLIDWELTAERTRPRTK